MNFANFLTISRVILILPVLFFISEDSGLNNWLALFLFVSAGVTDNLDGYIARKTGTESSLGALLDLLADKLLVIITTAYLISYQTHENLWGSLSRLSAASQGIYTLDPLSQNGDRPA